MSETASDLARSLAEHAEAVCRHYLSNGRRYGHYWLVGDVRNVPGRSMFVRLEGAESGKGATGKWTDAATGEHGDLLDVIRESCGLIEFRDVAEEARRFLRLPHPEPRDKPNSVRLFRSSGSGSARRLFAISRPVPGTLAETYLRHRGITDLHDADCLRFHPSCYYRPDPHKPVETWPAMIAPVTDLAGKITGVQRTYLDPYGRSRSSDGKASIDTPRRAMGDLLGNAVRFGAADNVLLAGEGIETILSLRMALPFIPMAAALSAAHLAALLFPASLCRLYIARDADPAGERATDLLAARAQEAGIEAIPLSPRLGDFNEDLRAFGVDELRAALRTQIAPEDVARFTQPARRRAG
ncbi:toprim domain-containing protein [Methylovirgula sp. HY1]|uniref:DUF7146 domain-containing protein n=1 Tax=Methylovirgula sp. HY1 TaxID=2822761 RepID=UPI001C5AB077|nr:toprim domain-containing protein [Methylovirgula sp. HY1]QXX76151.1 hypothetical protein MHY1_02986 [Methylovirgula sp. HY1]